MVDDTREEYLRGADTEAARGDGTSTERGGREAGMPGPSDEPAGRAADSGGGGEGRAGPATADGGGSKREALDDATDPVTDPGPTS